MEKKNLKAKKKEIYNKRKKGMKKEIKIIEIILI